MPTKIHNICLTIGLLLAAVPVACANNLSVSNVSLGARDPGTKTLVVKFDLSWENSWRNKINHDAVWLTARLNKNLCQISAAGLNPAGSSTGTATNLEFYAPSDKYGVFVRRSSNGSVGNVSTQNAQMTINYDSCGFTDSDQVSAGIFGMEMVFVPQGSFFAGDYDTGTASLNKGSADNAPWYINSENAVSVANPANNGFHYVSNNNAGEYATGSTFTIPAPFPKGYGPFYVMKYEITEGQWVEFLNSLPAAARANRDLTDNVHKNSDSVVERNTIACSGSPLTCSTQRSSRAVGFLTWMDLAAFLDWNALRPMTELEFEKIARGPVLPVPGEYVWGATDITPAAAISGNEDGAETIATTAANARYDNTVLSGGDASGGGEHQRGPLRAGVFATAASTRSMAGAGYYGVMDLGGNLKERVINIGNAAGLAFTGSHGNGGLTGAAGYEGNADVSAWPGFDAAIERGVTGADGSGFRGGSWADSADRLRTSDRHEAVLTLSTAAGTFGGRGARTYDGN
ncbi:MAG: hypothetical protein HY591_06425 [Candidatus Omnitrophica bacterium]|nr:hypothetical protein [Candidatus Omnitrophota bacterium]